MTITEFLQWIVDHKEYAPLYSSLVATMALLFSILSFVISNIISKNRAKKEKEISDARYEEQKKRYEEQLNEERKRREEDKHDAEEKVRISEEPYLVFKNSKIFSNSPSEHVILQMEFLNKGRGSAYEIIPDLECSAKTLDMKEFHIYRYGAVEDPIAMVGETFVICWKYKNEQKTLFRMTPEIRFKDASGRKYKQTYNIDIVDRLGKANIINYAQPKLCED